MELQTGFSKYIHTYIHKLFVSKCMILYCEVSTFSPSPLIPFTLSFTHLFNGNTSHLLINMNRAEETEFYFPYQRYFF